MIPFTVMGGAAGAYLSRINKPNLAGTACNFQSAVLFFLAGTHGNWGLPGEVVFPLPPDTVGQKVLDTLICQSEFEITLTTPQGYDHYTWNDAGTDTVRTVAQRGTYWVVCKDECHSRTDTFVIRGVDIQFSLGTDTLICAAPPFRLSAAVSGAAFLWSDGATDSFYTVTGDGTYWVATSKEGCAASDTIDVRFKDIRQQLGNDLLFCKGDPISVVLKADEV